MSIQTDGPMLGCSIEEILRDVNDTGISMVHFARKPIHNGFYGLTLPSCRQKWADDGYSDRPLISRRLRNVLDKGHRIL
jgi:hypothetical protein